MTMGLQKALASLLAAIFIMSGCQTPPETGPEPSAAPPAESGLTLQKAELAHKMAWEYQAEHKEAESAPLVLTRENFPRLAASVSGKPLAQAAVGKLLGNRAPYPLTAGNAADPYRALMDGTAGVILAAEPDRAVWDRKEAAGFEWEMSPVAADALVFVVNADNPVENLTVRQARAVFAGQTANWSELGGAESEITIYESAGTGCRTALANLVMDGVPAAEIPAEQRYENLNELLKAVSAREGAIACASWYCAANLCESGGWKLLSVDGTAPGYETIRSGAYPLLNSLYVLTAAGQSGPARSLYDWFLSAEGRRAAVQEGYVPAGTTGGAA